MTIWKDASSRVITGLVTAAVLGIFGLVYAVTTGWFSSIVHAGEMEGFVGMVIEGLMDELDPRLSAIEGQLEATKAATSRNSVDLTRSRIQNIDAAMRDLTKEIQEMEKAKADRPSDWGRNDEALLEEWNRDLDDLVCERTILLEPNVMPPECL